MKKKKPTSFENDLIERLKNPEFAVHYLNELAKDRTAGSKERFLLALRRMAQAYGVTKLSAKVGRSRESLYITLSKKGNPTHDVIQDILETFGIETVYRVRKSPKKAA